MKNNKKIQFLLLFFTMLIGFVFATTVNADVTKDGDVYHITTGQDLDMLLGLGNNSGYWNGTDNKTPTSIKISVDNDITLVKQQHEINSVFKDTIDIDFNDHMYYVTEQDNSSFKMDKSTLVDVFVRNLKSSESNVANTTGTLAGVPDPTDATKTVAGYLLSANSLFTGAGDQGTANGTVTYDNVLINYPNIHDGKSQMLTTGYVPIKFTGTNLLALGGQSGDNFCRTTDLTVVDGDTTMTWGPGLGGNSIAMFNMRDGVGFPTSSVNFTVGSGATLTINNHVNTNTIASGNNAGKIVNITNNGILTATIDGYATDSSSSYQTATSSFVSGGTGLTNTNITFGPNAVTTITSNTGLIQMDKVAILNIKAQSNHTDIKKYQECGNGSCI